MIKKILVALAALVVIVLAFRYCEFKDDEARTVMEETTLIQQQIENVGKLVVTEGHFSEVITYKDTQKRFGFYNAEKKAIVIVNADVTVAYDLHKVTYNIDDVTKVITITSLPEAEIKISPDLKYYDIVEDNFNAFTGNDYNKIAKQAKESIAKKIEKSTLKTNAQNRLVSELQKILILTNTMGWTLQYKGEAVTNDNITKVAP
ncbi:hypothetical protein AM493_18425 [Flavobacterium akiainvivens]|uniref:DUF4230 domain-containing protein n=1 Tax=Flavobacterium akiainvivens TaxID=1202724 RepID=A0A0M8MKP3_9FLAO|nr:DUF4230 domain-containing protein [Flavobacterium akiainvivens]KOS07807.1 hypothetical protein AM493_18425 [Flavobacterium akiainvivens]SFQ26769.1 Protein of unknown function [Flavobacterium akiainvivens]